MNAADPTNVPAAAAAGTNPPDILELLRRRATCSISNRYEVAAADEIERLRGMLREANEAFDFCAGDYSKGLVDGEPWRDFRGPA